MKNLKWKLLAIVLACLPAISAFAGSVAIVQGGFYTTNLRDNLTTAGHTVTEIPNYTAVSLAAYDAVIQDGNSFVDTAELRAYAEAGGTVILIPWSAQNWIVPVDMQVMENSGAADFSVSYPGVDVFDPSHPLLNGVVFPDAPAGFNIGRVNNIGFVAEATAIAEWGDGQSAFLGTRTVGSGRVIHLNMHIITSDTAYIVIDQDWAITLVSNMIGPLNVEPRAAFNVTKAFSDGEDFEVDVNLTCNTGLPLSQDFTITGGDPVGVTFVITEITPGATNCEVTETGHPDGYTPIYNGGNECVWTEISGGFYTCEIYNQANPATFTVYKEWEIFNNGGDAVIEEAYVTIYCDSEILNGLPGKPAENGLDNGNGEYYTISDYLGDGDSLTATVDTTDGPTTCWAYESVSQSGVESSDDCGPREIAAGGSSSCTFVNTVFFEAIPTLGQYGLALMALLMLGVGLVGFRRFA